MGSKIIAFGASNSRKSINAQLAAFAANKIKDVEIQFLDLNDFEMPIFGVEREAETGAPKAAKRFAQLVSECDGIIISFAEHNGSYSTAFKNIFDWISRISKPIWQNKPMLLLATSPGQRGGQTVLNAAVGSFPHQGAQVVAHFSLPSFHANFKAEVGINEAALSQEFENAVKAFSDHLSSVETSAS